MVLPAAAQTASMLHPPEARPANPPTLPLSAPTGSGEEGGVKRRGSRGMRHAYRSQKPQRRLSGGL